MNMYSLKPPPKYFFMYAPAFNRREKKIKILSSDIDIHIEFRVFRFIIW